MSTPGGIWPRDVRLRVGPQGGLSEARPGADGTKSVNGKQSNDGSCVGRPRARKEHAVTISKSADGYRLSTWVRVAAPLCEVFDFFSDAFQLESITPPWLQFSVLSPRPIEMRAGVRIHYKLRLHGVPIRWQSAITVWQPPVRFVDEQIVGPYRFWRHEHSFHEEKGGTLVSDRVDYGVRGGALVHRWLVAPDLKRIFQYRQRRLRERFTSTFSG